MVTDLVPGRECGACQACCIVPAIDHGEMQKQPGVPCRHCLKGDCDIYESRPGLCRKYFCGWRKLASLNDDWRPDKSGLLIESGNPSQFGAGSMILMLTGNPLKTLRRQGFMDFVCANLQRNLLLYLSLPGPPGKKAAALPLNTPEMRAAMGQSRSHVRQILEQTLQRLNAHEFVPHVMEHHGNDFSS